MIHTFPGFQVLWCMLYTQLKPESTSQKQNLFIRVQSVLRVPTIIEWNRVEQ